MTILHVLLIVLAVAGVVAAVAWAVYWDRDHEGYDAGRVRGEDTE